MNDMPVKGNGKRYARCSVEPGIFSGELLVTLRGVDPAAKDRDVQVVVLVDAGLVLLSGGKPARGQPVAGLLRVGVANTHDRFATVVLPQPGIPVGDTVLMRSDDLVRVTE